MIILPVCNDGRLIIRKQFRPALLLTNYGFLAGTLEPGEEPERCAWRELAKQSGNAAASGENLGVLYLCAGVLR